MLEQTSRRFNVPVKKLIRTLYGPSVFNDFTHEKQRHMAYIRLTLAEHLSGDNLLAALKEANAKAHNAKMLRR